MGPPSVGNRYSGNNVRFKKNPRNVLPKLNNETNLSADGTSVARKMDEIKAIDSIDEKMGFSRYEHGPKKTGWLINMHSTVIPSEEILDGLAGVDYYFLDEDGGSFKTTVNYDPYFFVSYKKDMETELEEYLRRTLEGGIKKINRVKKEDLKLANHLVGKKRSLLQLLFHNVNDLLKAKHKLMPIVEINKRRAEIQDTYEIIDEDHQLNREVHECITDIYEYDVPYHVRVAIDKDIRVGHWYTVEARQDQIEIEIVPDRDLRADPVVMAYDIETTKAPLKFPDSAVDKVMMISYMIDGDGYLITNREIVSKDIDDFEYTPKPEFPGLFTIFNEKDEKALLERFFEHIKEERPTVIATFNGDFFDWPFVEARAKHHGINMYEEIGFKVDNEGEFKSAHCVHMDCFRWVKRDSYLPQGSQGLKSVTTAKLGYNPIEIDPELMTPYAVERPQIMAEYSVSDAVATYYLYMKYVHPFVFSLCTIIPLNPDEVLRKGTGTLCEMLLMVQAYKGNILFPQKYKEPAERFYNGHLVESETYVGGHVESLEAGVFRSDIPTWFNIDPKAIDELLRDLDDALRFAIEVEGKSKMEDVTNYDEVKQDISSALIKLRDKPKRDEKPLIYHVDVASMYPNIITTNRLQPDAMVTEEDCAACDFNRPGKVCDRRLPWSWRGDFLPAKKDEYLLIKNTLATEMFPGRTPNAPLRRWDQLAPAEQTKITKQRVQDYCRKVYKKVKQTETMEREAIICQKENPFYVNTVRSFRDRRYEFKGLQKTWKKNADSIGNEDPAAKEEAKKKVVLYDSMQLAHKVILNSFYGYVMRKGSRWYSMEMGGVTCLTGATIIQMARSLVERLGRPLELDTDGIWCILPESFPEDFFFNLKNGKKLAMSYPCGMLNHLVHAKFSNHQYQTLVDPKTLKYETSSDNSIFFELDGPYKAMVLPTSKEEDKGLKKRYAVFNNDGSLAELKGFELKRRGELRLIKAFQGQLFSVFLDGKTLDECYRAVGKVANSWLDIIDSHGRTLEDEDLMDLISENRSMSKTLEEYGAQKSTSICTARRLAEFLGSQMVKDKGLACKYIISREPVGRPVTERAVPVEIFSADIHDKSHYLRKWLKNPTLESFDPRGIIDWDYYRERLASTIQKIITIPAALQYVQNPVPRIPHPVWLEKRVAAKINPLRQQDLSSFLNQARQTPKPPKDIEELGTNSTSNTSNVPKIAKVTVAKRKNRNGTVQEETPTLPPQVPSTDDYREWLKYNKIKWKIQDLTRKRRQQLFGTGSSNSSGIISAFRDQNERAYSNTWQILQYLPSVSGIPGEVRAYALINDKIQNVRINIQRKIFVSLKQGQQIPDFSLIGCTATPSTYNLPNGQTSDKLFQLTMPEETYLKEIQNPDSVLNSPAIESMFESQITPEERALLSIRASCSLSNTSPGLFGKGLESGFEGDWLTSGTQEYLNTNIKFNYVHLVHIVYMNYQIFSLFKPWDRTCTSYVLRGKSHRTNIGESFLPNVAKLYRQLMSQQPSTAEMEYPDEIEYTESLFDSANALYKKLGVALTRIVSENGSKAILCVQSPQPRRLKKLIRPMNEFPCVDIRPPTTPLPSIGWQLACSKRIVKSFLGLGAWLEHLKKLAKFSNIPLGNLRCDNMDYLIDIMYARRLMQQQCVLWWSHSPIPDEGGIEKDSILPSLDPLDLPVVNNPGLHGKVCLDFKIANLLVNTLAVSSLVDEEKAEMMTIEKETGTKGLFIDNAFSTEAFSVLSSMLREWYNKAISGDDVCDSLVHGFVGWVSCPVSLLYDRALFYHVQNVSKTSFVHLIAEMRRAGAQIVFADEHRLLVSTSKNVVENSFSYGNYLIKSIRSRPQFQLLDITVTEYWDTLLWMDKSNYGGRSCRQVQSDNQELDMVGHWHIKSFLPAILQVEFDSWVNEFLLLLCNARDKSKGEDGLYLHDEEDQENDSKPSIFAGILKSLDKPLTKRIQQLQRRFTESLSDPDVAIQFKYPVLPGSKRQKGSPILQLVKYLSKLFNLGTELEGEAQLIGRHMLEILDIKEFSEEANFQDPSASLKLSKIVCERCSYIRDIDLCRDDELVREIDGHHGWICENCGHEYSRLLLEERLIQSLEQALTKFQVQDLQCNKCKKIRDDYLSMHCSCSGTWVETVPMDEMRGLLQTYGQVSNYYNFKMVTEILDGLGMSL